MSLSVQLREWSEMLVVQSPGEEELLFPYVWLRDNCQCSKCFHPVSQARLLLLEDLNVDAKPTHAEVDNKEDTVYLVWSDGHRGSYPVRWLQERAFTEAAIQKRSKKYQRTKKLWGSEYKVPIYDFEKVLNDDKDLYGWLKDIEIYGLVLLKNAPTETGQLMKLGKRVAFLRKTHYGEIFTVKSKRDPSNLAYTGLKLGLHVDGPWYRYSPGVQMLHCIAQYEGEGGENDFSDGFYVAKLTKERDPEAFRTLETTPVDYWDIGEDAYKFDKVIPVCIFETNKKGELQRINLSQQTRDSYMNIPLDQVKPFYRAMKNFNTALYENSIRMKMEEGDIVCFDNQRVLHGRTEFHMNQTGCRHLEGGYFDWDEVRSMQNVIKKELNID